MQKGRILLTIFFSVFSLLLISFATFLIFKTSASQKNKSMQKTLGAQIMELKIDTTPTFPPSPTQALKRLSRPSTIIIPKSLPNPTPILSPTSVQLQPSDLNPNDYILKKVNEYRGSSGLSEVYPNSETCDFAKTRAQEISSLETFNHEGFTSKVNNKTLPYSSYSEVTENIAYNTDFKDVVNRWIASSGHEQNLRKDTPYVCIGNHGDYYVYEGMRP